MPSNRGTIEGRIIPGIGKVSAGLRRDSRPTLHAADIYQVADHVAAARRRNNLDIGTAPGGFVQLDPCPYYRDRLGAPNGAA